MFGTNKITKQELEFNGTININSIFYTIQGEGPLAGTPATFIRFQGCNLKCFFCDTEFDSGKPMSVPLVVDRVKNSDPQNFQDRPLVVITGGEPFLQKGLIPLIKKLLLEGFQVQVESACSVWLEGFSDLKAKASNFLKLVCSPKTGKINENFRDFIDAYKYVIRAEELDENDGLPGISPQNKKPLKLARPFKGSTSPVYITPCDEKDAFLNNKNEKAVMKLSMDYGYIICLQLHKILNID